MNYLAHLLLADDEDEARVGQVLADFVDARSIVKLPRGIQAGIRAHQAIDVFSDGHPAFGAARRRLRPPYRRYAGVLIDMYFDHYLAANWVRHGSGEPLAEFAASCYEVLFAHRHLQAGRFQHAVESMRAED